MVPYNREGDNEMSTYQIKLNVDVLFEGSLNDCLKYLVGRFGDETLSEVYGTGYRIEPVKE